MNDYDDLSCQDCGHVICICEDDYYDEDREMEREMERQAACWCGAWQWSEERAEFIHVADCVCGAM